LIAHIRELGLENGNKLLQVSNLRLQSCYIVGRTLSRCVK
jgi:hypothetical protein